MAKTFFYIFLYALLNVSGAALIKWNIKNRSLGNIRDWIKFMADYYFILAFVLIVFSALALFKSLSENNFSFIIPIATGMNFLFTAATGYYFFRDRLSVFSFLGFLLIICGIIILSINNQVHAQHNLSK
jgi:multidrug transporter EmrE-like cation transporter